MSKSFGIYPQSLKLCLANIYKLTWIVFQVYGLTFLASYVFIAFGELDYILMNGKAYIALIHPLVFLAQIITVLVFVLLWHFFEYYVNIQVFWRAVPVYYGTINFYTKIPYIL